MSFIETDMLLFSEIAVLCMSRLGDWYRRTIDWYDDLVAERVDNAERPCSYPIGEFPIRKTAEDEGLTFDDTAPGAVEMLVELSAWRARQLENYHK